MRVSEQSPLEIDRDFWQETLNGTGGSAIPVHALIEEQVDRTPHQVAVRAKDQSLTYAALDRRANQLAHRLRGLGVTAGSRVGILLVHSVDTLVALLGVLKAGAAYVPLDANHPVSRLAFTLEDASVTVLVTSSDLAALAGSGRTVLLDADPDLVAQPTTRLGLPFAPDDLAYVIYTSGSTGDPKGVAVPHRALTNYVWWARSVYLENRVFDSALHSSLAFDLTVTSIFPPLTTGGAVLAYAPPDGEPPIFDVLLDDRVDIIKLTPSHLALVAEMPVMPSRVRVFVVGGEQLDTSLARRIHDRFNGRVAIFNEYGPTEATVGCMIHRFDRERDTRAVVPVGVPAANTRIYVLDRHLEPVAPNLAGELYIGGAGLARGYLGQPTLTAESFVPDPFRPGERMYRTGDSARRLPEGIIEFRGRNDNQIKVHGHRIDLNEIRSQLMRHGRVRNCVVRRLEETDGRSVLVAYCATNEPIDNDELRSFARERLIHAAVPAVFVCVRQLPTTSSGKVDARALPGLDRIRAADVVRPAEPPDNATQGALARIWRRLLGIELVSVQSRFFDLGGDSLLAMRLFLEIESVFGVALRPAALFPDDRLLTLAANIENRQTLQRQSAIVPIRPDGNRRPLFLVHSIGGEVLSYLPLVQHLDESVPVYGLQGLGAGHPPGSSLQIESMASQYVSAIRELQREGPYQLGGYSAGGLIAFEMARQLRANGDEVALLAIIDGDAPASVRNGGTWPPAVAGRFLKNLGFWLVDDLLQTTRQTLSSRIGSKIRLFRTRLASFAPTAGNADIRDALGVPDMHKRVIPWLEAFSDAMKKYRPAPYPGKITLLRARTVGLFEAVPWDRGWGSLADGGVDVRQVKGDHTSILREPAVARLAHELDGALHHVDTCSAGLQACQSGRI